MINYMAELSLFNRETVVQPTPTNDINKRYNIYYIDLSPHPNSSYWLDWGGYYDTYTEDKIVLYYSKYLEEVYTLQELLQVPYSMYFFNNNFNRRICLINLSIHPWLYPDHSVLTRRPIFFLSIPLNPNNPSDLEIRTGEYAKILLEPPNFSIKLSDAINGINLNQSFNIYLINNDGYFDDEDIFNFFNVPLTIKKSTVENPKYDDFKEIRRGYITDASTDFQFLNLSSSDLIKSMNQNVCKTINNDEISSLIGQPIMSGAIDKFIPLVYGTAKINLIQLTSNLYYCSEYTKTIHRVLDRNGNSVPFSNSLWDNIINVPTGNAVSAVITGYDNNNLCAIIKDLIYLKSGIPFGPSYWNVDETNDYEIDAPDISISFNSGDIKNAVQRILKNDISYLIQQTDGRLTVRKYNNTYKTHDLKPWMITQKPKKLYSIAMINYFSSCIIEYLNNDIFNENKFTFLFNELESWAESNYGKVLTSTFDTDLISIDDVDALARLLSYRYTNMRQTIEVPVGYDTSVMELLDTVNLELDINDRKFSKASKFIIKEINQTQDILVLEEI